VSALIIKALMDDGQMREPSLLADVISLGSEYVTAVISNQLSAADRSDDT